jgi:hypothetical protein
VEAQSIKHMSIKEFLEAGLLQELNRQFLHPRGLALEIIVPDDSDAAGEYKFGNVWDYREDPEGMLFGGESPKKEKAIYAQTLLDIHSGIRMNKYGWIIQPLIEKEKKE